MPHSHIGHKHIPSSFVKKKSQILSEISNHDSIEYNDKSPKGTIDSEIITLIDEINAFDGYVTTSSCAGRVAVFVEGRKAGAATATRDLGATNDTGDDADEDGLDGPADLEIAENADEVTSSAQGTKGAGPGGKGHGNRWLYVSHERVPSLHLASSNPTELHDLFQITPQSLSPRIPSSLGQPPHFIPRLIKLSFSPLILHILCANLHAAKGVLAAAINAGFRESGVPSLRALDDEDAGVMVGIRTAGITFEAVVGLVEEVDGQEVYSSLVDEQYLRMCIGVINERFGWNVERRERLRGELAALRRQEGKDRQWEDKDVRRERKRLEGLRRKQEQEEQAGTENGHADEEDVLNDGLLLDAT